MFLYIYYTHLSCLLLHTQHCCHLLVGKVPNEVKKSLHSKKYEREDKRTGQNRGQV